MRSTLIAGLALITAIVDSQCLANLNTTSSALSLETSTSSAVDYSSSSALVSSSSSTASISVSSNPSTSSLSLASIPAASSSATAITVARDGSAQYTAVGAAITAAQNSGIATVSVLPGTYTEAVLIPGTQTVTIVGATPAASAYRGYVDNQVVITTSGTAGAVGFGTSGSKGATFKHLNLTNSATTGTAPAFYNKAANVALYSCALISSSTGVYFSSYSTALIYNSYIEGTDKLFTNFPTVYVYGSTISPLNSNALIMYAKGLAGSPNYNATLVVDSSAIVPKPGYTNTYVYLAAGNGAYTQAIYRNTSLASFIAPSAWYSDSCTKSTYYGEFQTTGAGAYSSTNSAARSAVCGHSLTAGQMDAFTISQVFGNNFPGYASFDTTWIDSNVLSVIRASESAQSIGTSTSVSAATSSISTASMSSATSSVSTTSSSTLTLSSSAAVLVNSTGALLPASSTVSSSSSTSTAASATCASLVPSATLIVSLNATACQYSNVSAAVAALPNDSKDYTILIMPGTYNEQLSITRNGKVTLIGQTTYANDYTKNTVKIQFSSGRLTSLGQNEQTPIINAKKANDNSGLAVYNIDFVNTYPQTSNTAALAADFYGANIAAYGCSFIGFQDTLLANKGTQVFSNCYIEGSVDFIWGFSTAYFRGCYLATNTKGSCIAAQSRTAGTVSGYVFDSCYVTYTSTYGSTFGASFLGRPYNNFSTAVYMNSYLDKHISVAGWQVWSTSNPQTSNVTFAEFNNTGAGSWQAGRASFATNLTTDQAQAYTLANWIGDTSWIDMTAYNYIPSFTIPSSAVVPSTSASASATATGPTSTATVNAHPESGSAPPFYAVLVSPNGQVNGSYSNLTAALASLPSDSTNQTIFVYAGIYTEQVPTINRPGAVRIIGYTTSNPGQSYKDNQVTITFSRGLSVSPLPVGHSDAETATIQTSSNRISFYNINIVNSDNLDGTESSYVTLASSIYGNDIGFYACYFQGWQDTLLTGATAGYQYYESCYIGGAIDFIWGYSKAYFKGCTIGAKRAKSAITAHSRASSTAIGGYIFDQCLFTQAPDATVDLTNTVYLGRPYSQYALVVIKNSYIDDVINPVGWKSWSATDLRTDHITFAEYNNQGPSNWENNAAARLSFGNATLLTSDTYPLESVMDSTSWIDMTYWTSISTPQPVVVNTTTSANVTTSGTSIFNGTTPPSGALIVSKTAIDGVVTYSSIQAALNAAPVSSKVNATIFIYPGVYQEQLIVNKSGTTIFRGYSDATDDYNSNQVIIQQSYGVDTQGGGSDVDAATVYAKGNYFYAYNINFRNNNGTQQNIASLGFAVQSSKYAFMHACQVYGNQDTLYISGYYFAHKSYVEGNVDFIFGAGSGYFLNSTISPNEDGAAITAAKRATNTTQAGFVFDQCTLEPAAGYSGFTNVSLGRPWNNNANVLYVDSYLDSMIGPAGWTQWSRSAPQTDGVTFAEYHNSGPGSSICKRASFSKQLSDSQVVSYQLGNFFTSISWIDLSVVDVQPFAVGVGSAPVCSSATISASASAVVPTIVPVPSSFTSPSSVSLATVYITQTIVDKETLFTTTQLPGSTKTFVSVVTQNGLTTTTASPYYKTSVVKTTTTLSITSTQAANTVTLKSTQTSFQTTSVVGKDVLQESTSVITQTKSMAGKTSTLKATTTVYQISTYTPQAMTSTINLGGTQTVYVTSTAKGVKATSTITVNAGGSVKTSTVKASTITSVITSLKTTNKKTTITQTCVPTAGAAARLFRRGLEARAPGTTTITQFTTQTSFVKTSTATLTGSTSLITVISTQTATAANTQKPATSTLLVTSYATKTSTVTQSASAATVTSLAYVTSLSTVMIRGSTSTSLVYSTAYITKSQAILTITSYATKFSVSVITAPQSTITQTRSAGLTTTITAQLPASTSTVLKTVTVSDGAKALVVTPTPVTVKSTVKATSTVYSTITKTSKNAPDCTA